MNVLCQHGQKKLPSEVYSCTLQTPSTSVMCGASAILRKLEIYEIVLYVIITANDVENSVP